MAKVGRPRKTHKKTKQVSIYIPEEIYWDVKSFAAKKRITITDFFINSILKEINKEKRRRIKYENGEDWNI